MTHHAELDYALLAQWARVNNDGTLTIIDGSFLSLRAELGSVIPLAVAGRVRLLEEPYQTSIAVTIELPGGVSTSFTTEAEAPEATKYGEGRRHVLFAVTTHFQVLSEGLAKVRVVVEGGEENGRDLYFAVSKP